MKSIIAIVVVFILSVFLFTENRATRKIEKDLALKTETIKTHVSKLDSLRRRGVYIEEKVDTIGVIIDRLETKVRGLEDKKKPFIKINFKKK